MRTIELPLASFEYFLSNRRETSNRSPVESSEFSRLYREKDNWNATDITQDTDTYSEI